MDSIPIIGDNLFPPVETPVFPTFSGIFHLVEIMKTHMGACNLSILDNVIRTLLRPRFYANQFVNPKC
jgi:hypothetical protein